MALVGERHRQVRRRSVVLGAGAALGAAAVTTWAARSVLSGAASTAAPRPPGPDDPAWSRTSTWPARGRLATDPGVLALVAGASPRAHLLYADDVAGRRVVVAATADVSGAGGTLVRMWAGSRGAAAGTLVPANLVRDRVMFTDDIVPVAVEAGPDDEEGAGAVLLLARPMVLEAAYSPLVSYTRTGGEVSRRWSEVALRDGVATVPIRGSLPPAFRVRLDGYDGGPLGATPLGLPTPSPSGPLAESLLEALGPFVAACTGLPVSAVSSRIALEAPVPGDVLVQAASGETPGEGRVVIAHTSVPSGALLRSIRVGGDGRGEAGPVDVETTRVVSPDAPTAPVAARLPSFTGNMSRFLVVAPGAARAQLVAQATSTYPASGVTGCATAPACSRWPTRAARRSTGWSPGTGPASGSAPGSRASAAATRETCGRGCGDPGDRRAPPCGVPKDTSRRPRCRGRPVGRWRGGVSRPQGSRAVAETETSCTPPPPACSPPWPSRRPGEPWSVG